MKRRMLSNNEFSVMRVLWGAGGPLSRPEILNELADNDWNPNSIHMVLNNLIKKGFVTITGVVPCGQSYGRAYSAAKSQEEYAAELALDAVSGTPQDERVLGIMSAMVRSVSVSEETIEQLKRMLEQRRQELREDGQTPEEG